MVTKVTGSDIVTVRKPKEKYSKKAKAVLAMANKLAINANSNPTWALTEAIHIETPIGEVHLHWSSRRGHGNWNIVSNPQWRGEICGTIRCRRVVITPLGGENESVPYDAETFDEFQNKWQWTREGACCYWPKQKVYYIKSGKEITESLHERVPVHIAL